MVIKTKRLAISKARPIWKDTALTGVAALALMRGWTWKTAYRKLGVRHPTRGLGRKPGEKSKRKARRKRR